MASITATNNASTFEPIAAGNYFARCYSMVDLGTQNTGFKDEAGEDKWQRQVRIGWELPDESFEKDGHQRCKTISGTYTLSMNEKANLRKILESWRGASFTDEQAKAFDVTKLLGVACMLNIIHKTSNGGKLYANVSAVTSVPKGMGVKAQVNKTEVFTFEEYSDDSFSRLPDYLKDIIKKSTEWNELSSPSLTPISTTPANEVADDLPF